MTFPNVRLGALLAYGRSAAGLGTGLQMKILTSFFFKEKLGSPNILKTVTVEWSKLLQHLDGLKKRPQKAQTKSSHSRVHKAELVSFLGKLYLCCYRRTSSRRGTGCDN